jgi:DNA uptake protein ComE-like DNA-binding protein
MTPIARLLLHSVGLFILLTNTSVGAATPSEAKLDAAIATPANKVPARSIDINSATLTDLRSLPGIGTANARKIVAGRPYTSTDDLKTRKVLSKGTYDKIRDRISVKGAMSGGTANKPDMPAPGTEIH